MGLLRLFAGRKRVRVRRGGAAGLAMLAATALTVGALAQQPKARPAAKPRPAATGDASAPPASEETSSGTPIPGSQAPAGASTLDGGAIPPPPARVDLGDGGVKLSPLNPAAPEMPGTTPPPVTSAAVDYDKLLGDIAALRARVAAVGDALFVARIALAVETGGSHARIGRMTISLDDGVVYTAPAGFHADDTTPVYDHAVAPGRHAVTVDVDRRDDRDESFKDTEHSRFIVDVPPDNKLSVVIQLSDDSNMGGKFASDRSGKYDLRVRMKASATPVAAKR